MKLTKRETTKDNLVKVRYTITDVSPLEYEALCKGLELLQDCNGAEGVRALNMLDKMNGLRKETLT